MSELFTGFLYVLGGAMAIIIIALAITALVLGGVWWWSVHEWKAKERELEREWEKFK